MEIKMIDTIFKSDIKKKFDEKWISIGKVDSTYLKIDDEYVINPLTGNPYIVPVGYDPKIQFKNFFVHKKNRIC